MQSSLLDQGVTLMLVGMGTVFVFLTLLVIGMSMMSAIAMRLTPAPESDAAGVSDEEVAAMTAAIAIHRNRP